MRLRIDKIWFIVVALVLSVPSAHAQIVTANPLEWMALAEGNEAINGEIEKEIKGQTKTALLQNTIAAEFTKIHEWEKKYNSYLKTASEADKKEETIESTPASNEAKSEDNTEAAAGITTPAEKTEAAAPAISW